MKKKIIFLLSASIVIDTMPNNAFGETKEDLNKIDLLVNSKNILLSTKNKSEEKQKLTNAPCLNSANRVLIPGEAVKKMGVSVDWDKNKKEIKIKTADKTIIAVIGQKSITVNGKTMQLRNVPEFQNDAVFIPVDLVEQFANVTYMDKILIMDDALNKLNTQAIVYLKNKLCEHKWSDLGFEHECPACGLKSNHDYPSEGVDCIVCGCKYYVKKDGYYQYGNTKVYTYEPKLLIAKGELYVAGNDGKTLYKKGMDEDYLVYTLNPDFDKDLKFQPGSAYIADQNTGILYLNTEKVAKQAVTLVPAELKWCNQKILEYKLAKELAGKNSSTVNIADKAIAEFQKAKNGSKNKTYNASLSYLATYFQPNIRISKTTKYGGEENVIKTTKEALKILGYDVAIDTKFDEKLLCALIDYQISKGFTILGSIDEMTYSALLKDKDASVSKAQEYSKKVTATLKEFEKEDIILQKAIASYNNYIIDQKLLDSIKQKVSERQKYYSDFKNPVKTYDSGTNETSSSSAIKSLQQMINTAFSEHSVPVTGVYDMDTFTRIVELQMLLKAENRDLDVTGRADLKTMAFIAQLGSEKTRKEHDKTLSNIVVGNVAEITNKKDKASSEALLKDIQKLNNPLLTFLVSTGIAASNTVGDVCTTIVKAAADKNGLQDSIIKDIKKTKNTIEKATLVAAFLLYEPKDPITKKVREDYLLQFDKDLQTAVAGWKALPKAEKDLILYQVAGEIAFCAISGNVVEKNLNTFIGNKLKTYKESKALFGKAKFGTNTAEVQEFLKLQEASKKPSAGKINVDTVLNQVIEETIAEAGGFERALSLSTRFLNKMDPLWENAGKIKPIAGYQDIICHGDKLGFIWKNTDGVETTVSVKKFAEILKGSPVYKGEPIRLISCETGADGAIAAEYLAKYLGVEVMAPTDVVHVYPDGKMVIGPDQWTNTGTWKIFKP